MVGAMTSVRGRDERGIRAAACRRSGAAWVIACCVVWGMPARAADDVPVDERPQGADRDPTPPDAQVFLGTMFDMNVFELTRSAFVVPGNIGPRAESPTLATLRAKGDARLARIAAICSLTETQRRKLRLAMDSDVRRLAKEIDIVRQKYQGVMLDPADQESNRRLEQFMQDVQQCRERLWRAFGDDCLFTKVLPTTLEPAQYARLTAEADARRTAMWKGLVAATLASSGDVLGLDQKQHEAIESLLLEKGPPLRADGFTNPQFDVPEVQRWIVWMALAETDWRPLRAGMSEQQCDLLRQFMLRGKAMRPRFESWGLLEHESR